MDSAATIASISQAATTALTEIQGDALNMIASVVPVAIVIMGAVLVVRIGIRTFKSVGNGR